MTDASTTALCSIRGFIPSLTTDGLHAAQKLIQEALLASALSRIASMIQGPIEVRHEVTFRDEDGYDHVVVFGSPSATVPLACYGSDGDLGESDTPAALSENAVVFGGVPARNAAGDLTDEALESLEDRARDLGEAIFDYVRTRWDGGVRPVEAFLVYPA